MIPNEIAWYNTVFFSPCRRKTDPIGIEIDIEGFLGLLITNPFLVSRNSTRWIHYGERKVDKLSDFDRNWFLRILRAFYYESALRFLKHKIAEGR